MSKIFKLICDSCNQEITPENVLPSTFPIQIFDEKGMHKIITGVSPITEKYDPSYDICKYCMIDAFNQLDKRPKVDSK